MSNNLLNEYEYLDFLNQLSSNYINYNTLDEFLQYLFDILPPTTVLSKIAFYELNRDTYELQLTKSNYIKDNTPDELFPLLMVNGTITNTLTNVETSYYYDNDTKESYICIPIIGYEGILGLLVTSSQVVDIEQSELLKKRLFLAANIIGLAINSIQTNIDKNYIKDMQEQIIAMKTIELRRNEHNLKLKMDQLTSNLSRSIPHEIRTPFLHIIGLSDMLLKIPAISEMEDSSEIKDIALDLNTAAKRLNYVLDNYIYYANLITKSFNSSDIENENSQFTEDTDSILFEIANELAYAHNRTDDLVLNLEPATIVGSNSMISKLFYEIISNAFIFSKKGTKIEITSIDLGAQLLVVIADHGLGMTEDEIHGIGPFVQFNRELNEQQGLGLGLSIATKILAILDGDIDIVSKKNVSTEIRLSLRKYIQDDFATF